MSKLTKVILQRPVAALVIVVGLIIFGISSVMGMSLELTPEMNMPMEIVLTVYPQAGPEDVEDLVTEEVEDGLGTLSGLDQIISQSQENMSIVILSFDYGTDMDDAFIDIQEAVERIKPNLPDGAEDPMILSMDMNAAPVMSLSVESDSVDVLSYVEDTVQKQLERVSDVAEVSVSGGDENYISVQLIPEALKQYRLSISTVSQAVASANFTMPAGSADYGSQTLALSSEVEYATPAEIGTIPITTPGGNVIHLSDVAVVQYDTRAPGSYSRYNGSENVSISITKNQSSSAVTLSGKVMKVVDELNAEYPDAHISVVYDSSETIVDSLKSVAQTLILGVILTMVVLFVFFGDLKGSLIVGSSMPISLLITFMLMSFMGFTLNMVTMGAMVIAIGMMVDNSIVVLEMCFRKRDEGMDFMDAAYEATKLVVNSLIASTITSVVVYLPLAMMEGMTGQLFKPLGFTIIFGLLASLISAITLVPLCFSVYKPVEKKEIPINKLLAVVTEKYASVLKKALHHKKMVALIAVVILGISFYLFRFVNMELMASTDEGQVSISVEFRPGTRLEFMDEKVRQIEEFVANSPYTEDYSASVTESSSMGSIMGGGSSTGSVSAYVADGVKLSTQEIVDEWARELNDYEENCEISVSSASSMGMTTGGGSSHEIALESDDLESLKEACRQLTDVVMKAPGVISVTSDLTEASSKGQIVIDPIKAAAAGMTPQQIAGSLYTIMSGSDAMDVTVDGEEYTVTVEYPEEEYATINDVHGIMLTNTSGQEVPLSDVAEIVFTDSPQTIQRYNGRYHSAVTASLESSAQFTAPQAIQELMAETILPEEVEQVTNTMDEMMNEEFGALFAAIITAVLLVYMVMAIEFENLRYSGMVMFCILFSLIGSIFLLLVTQSTLSMVSLMGFLMLIGIVVNNGILYVDNTNQLRKTMSTEEALIETGKTRLRPILMTTLTTILSMLPMALGYGKNGDMMQGMAVVIVGGLTASTVLTLLLLPIFYMIIHKRSKARKAKKKDIEENGSPEKKRRIGRKKKEDDLGSL